LAETDVEKKKWEAGYRLPAGLGELYISREIGRLKRLAEKPKSRRSLFMRGAKQTEPDYRELREEFRSFLRTMKDNVDLYLWFALSNLAERGVNRKLESKVYQLFGHVTSTFLYIEQNFDPSKVTPDLLAFLKDRITRIASPGAFDIQGHASTITQSGEGERVFLESVTYLEKLLAEVRTDLSKYFKKDEHFEAATKKSVEFLNR
jgi:hypothetical protein